MNRFEALHALGLEEDASEQDVRLACYGLEKAAAEFDFSDQERLNGQIEGTVNHAKEARSFLLSSRNQTAARKGQAPTSKKRGKLTVTPTEEKTAHLGGLERVREVVLGYAYNERSKIRGSIIALLLCIVVSFVILRYLRGMPRIVTFAIIGAVAVAGSSILTSAIMQSRKARAHVVELDAVIEPLRRDLGLEPVEGEDACADDDASAEQTCDAEAPEADEADDPDCEAPDAEIADSTADAPSAPSSR